MKYENIILETLERVKKLESEVDQLKKHLNKPITSEDKNNNVRYCLAKTSNVDNLNSKDNTKYLFNGARYGKNRLVLNVIKEYVRLNPKTTTFEIEKIFDYTLQGNRNLGVIKNIKELAKRHDYKRRYFSKSDEEIKLIDGTCLVCSQWGIDNINNFIFRAKQLGFKIEVISI